MTRELAEGQVWRTAADRTLTIVDTDPDEKPDNYVKTDVEESEMVYVYYPLRLFEKGIMEFVRAE